MEPVLPFTIVDAPKVRHERFPATEAALHGLLDVVAVLDVLPVEEPFNTRSAGRHQA